MLASSLGVSKSPEAASFLLLPAVFLSCLSDGFTSEPARCVGLLILGSGEGLRNGSPNDCSEEVLRWSAGLGVLGGLLFPACLKSGYKIEKAAACASLILASLKTAL